jgi:2-phospho-L-lactate guanylyltransferase
MTTRIAAIVPVAAFDRAKSRLGESLDPEERRELVELLLDQTLALLGHLLADRKIDDVLTISPDSQVLARAGVHGSRTLQQCSGGLNAAIREARGDVVARGADAILVVPIDLPCADGPALEEIRNLLDRTGQIVVLVTDRAGTGTNILALRPPTVIDVAFGLSSREAHRRATEAVGAPYVEVAGPLQFDLDTPDDLVELQSLSCGALHAH